MCVCMYVYVRVRSKPVVGEVMKITGEDIYIHMYLVIKYIFIHLFIYLLFIYLFIYKDHW